jgi:hypothetical protein
LCSLLFALSAIFIQFISIHKNPLIESYLSTDYYKIVLIRQNITIDSPIWVNYLTSICIRAVLPLLILISLYMKRYYLFWFSVLLGIFFCSSLIQKSYIALVFMPTIIFLFMNKQWKMAFSLISISFICIVLLFFVTNPEIRPSFLNSPHLNSSNLSSSDDTIYNKAINAINKSMILLTPLYDRVIIVPGKVVSQWFSLIPEHIPYGYGCGDRLISKILGCQHLNYSKIIYASLNPSQVKEGIFGTINAASFMEGYANFGLLGIILSAIEIGFWIALLSFFLADVSPLSIAVNSQYILLLSSTSFHTLLLSGGWAITIIFLFLLKNTAIGVDPECVG